MTVSHQEARLEIRHLLDLPVGDAFDMWCVPDLIAQWWGPHGFQTVVNTLDPRPGGRFEFLMIAPAGESCPMSGQYITVDRPDALVFDVHEHCIAGMPDSVARPTRPSRVEIRFLPRGEQTEIVLVQTGLASDYQLLAQAGWGDSLARHALAAR